MPDLVDHTLDFCSLGHVGFDLNGIRAMSGYFLDELPRIRGAPKMIDRNVRAGSGEGDRNGAPDAGRGAGHQCGSAIKRDRCHGRLNKILINA